jgi:hypothetical protein
LDVAGKTTRTHHRQNPHPCSWNVILNISLTYVSESIPENPVSAVQIQAIIEVARQRNPALDVTGALIATPKYFAQILEGPRAAVDELMLSISRDRRHRNISVVECVEIECRRFRHWTMAYCGFASYVDGHIHPLIANPADAGSNPALRRLTDLMLEFCR